MSLAYFVHWVKALIHNWDALTEMLKKEKNMSQDDIDKIKYLKNYLAFPLQFQREQLAHIVKKGDIQELKSLKSPPQMVCNVGNIMLIFFG
jgi:hypothetical protein